MRNITVVGAGQSGLMVALGLLKKGYKVTLLSDRTPEEIRTGRVLSSQGMFWQAIQNERDLGLRFWEDKCPKWQKIEFNTLTRDGQIEVSLCRVPEGDVESVDQRVKMPAWMEEFVKLGGDLRIEEVGIDELEHYAEQSDLVLMATGKGEIGRLFERDAEKSPFDQPMRELALTYVAGMEPVAPRNGDAPFLGLVWNGYPGVGEYFCCPCLTTTGMCYVMIFEGVMGGPMDCWQDVKTPEDHLQKSLSLLEKFFPWEAERCEHVELTDDNGRLNGRFPPTVRKPIAHLPSGQLITAIGDTVVVNDPLTGQGANNASKSGKLVHDRVVEHGDRPFDAQWMQQTFDLFWNDIQHVTKWTNALLTRPPAAGMKVMQAADENGRLADAVISGMNDASVFEPMFYDDAAADRFIASFLHRP